MLDAQSSVLAHCVQNLSLVLLSLAFLPLSTVLVGSCLFYNRLFKRAEGGLIQHVGRKNRLKNVDDHDDQGVSSMSRRQQQRTVLVTGVSMTKGLVLARLFSQAGHRVIGADFEPSGLPLSSGRVSRAVDKFYQLAKPTPSPPSSSADPISERLNGQSSGGPINTNNKTKNDGENQEKRKGDASPSPSPSPSPNPYVESLLSIVVQEKVDLWVSCSGVASAMEDGEAKTIIESRTACRAIQYDVDTTRTLHEKHLFIARAKELGLNVPDTHTVTSTEAVRRILFGGDGGDGGNSDVNEEKREEKPTARATKKYIMKTVGMDDASRGDMTLLPKSTVEETTAHLSRITIDQAHPWILQQFIPGKREFCTHALVIRGRVRAFVACPSAELLMHYEALPLESTLSRAMLAFTRRFAEESGDEFTGHLSFDFLVEEDELRRAREIDRQRTTGTLEKAGGSEDEDVVLWPIECNPRAHTAVVLFNDTIDMVDAYLSLLDEPVSSSPSSSSSAATPDQNRNHNQNQKSKSKPEPEPEPIITPIHSTRYAYFWLPHDLVASLILPVYQYLTSQIALGECYAEVTSFASRAVPLLLASASGRATWHDGTFVFWDPMPAWWLWHVQWPGMFLLSLYELVMNHYGGNVGSEAKDHRNTAGMWSRVNVSTGKMFGC